MLRTEVGLNVDTCRCWVAVPQLTLVRAVSGGTVPIEYQHASDFTNFTCMLIALLGFCDRPECPRRTTDQFVFIVPSPPNVQAVTKPPAN